MMIRVDSPSDLTRADLEDLLPREGFNPNSYRLYGGLGAGECYVLDHRAAGWEVYYSERGTKTGLQVYRSEDEACRYFLELLRGDESTRLREPPPRPPGGYWSG
jgi:hypothetical protein